MAIQGHPRSLILAPIESAYRVRVRVRVRVICNFLLVVNSNLGPIFPRFGDIAGFRRARPHPYSTRILGVFPLDEIADFVAPRSEDPKLIIPVINFELVEPICPRYVNVTDGRTDRQTDGQTDGRTDDLR